MIASPTLPGRYLGITYFEALVWVATMLSLMVNLHERFWPAFTSMAGWIVFVVFTLFYTQVGTRPGTERHRSRIWCYLVVPEVQSTAMPLIA
jgi:hypothetical protein